MARLAKRVEAKNESESDPVGSLRWSTVGDGGGGQPGQGLGGIAIAGRGGGVDGKKGKNETGTEGLGGETPGRPPANPSPLAEWAPTVSWRGGRRGSSRQWSGAGKDHLAID